MAHQSFLFKNTVVDQVRLTTFKFAMFQPETEAVKDLQVDFVLREQSRRLFKSLLSISRYKWVAASIASIFV